MSKRDDYDVLGVTKDVDSSSLKSAYRKLAMQFHPEKSNGSGLFVVKSFIERNA